jgi:hypothetical protein
MSIRADGSRSASTNERDDRGQHGDVGQGHREMRPDGSLRTIHQIKCEQSGAGCGQDDDHDEHPEGQARARQSANRPATLDCPSPQRGQQQHHDHGHERKPEPLGVVAEAQ